MQRRQVLGHHSTGKHSHAIYNRDLLAEPIRQLELILQRVRTGAFLPDASRSGMIAEPSKEDPSISFSRAESNSDFSESSSTYSSSDADSLNSDQYPKSKEDMSASVDKYVDSRRRFPSSPTLTLRAGDSADSNAFCILAYEILSTEFKEVCQGTVQFLSTATLEDDCAAQASDQRDHL